MGNSRAWPISFNLDLPLCFHRCESPFYNVVQVVLPAVGGSMTDTPRLLHPLPAQHQDKHMRRKQVPTSSNKNPHILHFSHVYSMPPTHTLFSLIWSFNHMLCFPFHALHSPSPSPIFCSLPPVFLSRAVLLYALSPAGCSCCLMEVPLSVTALWIIPQAQGERQGSSISGLPAIIYLWLCSFFPLLCYFCA